jgi:hypothetical protein
MISAYRKTSKQTEGMGNESRTHQRQGRISEAQPSPHVRRKVHRSSWNTILEQGKEWAVSTGQIQREQASKTEANVGSTVFPRHSSPTGHRNFPLSRKASRSHLQYLLSRPKTWCTRNVSRRTKSRHNRGQSGPGDEDNVEFEQVNLRYMSQFDE